MPEPVPEPITETPQNEIGAVIIGRNEGERLIRGLRSMKGQLAHMVYVDSGSSDGSVEAAQELGAHVMTLDTSKPFTAARARNAGLKALTALPNPPIYVQFMDGDCELQPGWIDTAYAHLRAHPKAAVACGRRRERFPEASIYNQMIDREWDTPIGEAKACGGDALMRISALEEIGGFNPSLIAGEEPELCVRLRQSGWSIWRLEAEMTLHDAALTRFGQWWKRFRRSGHAFAEGASLHGAPPEQHFVRETRSALIWGAALPLIILILALQVTPWALLGILIWPAQILRLRRKGMEWSDAIFLSIGKFPEAMGALGFHWNRLRGHRNKLIEYK